MHPKRRLTKFANFMVHMAGERLLSGREKLWTKGISEKRGLFIFNCLFPNLSKSSKLFNLQCRTPESALMKFGQISAKSLPFETLLNPVKPIQMTKRIWVEWMHSGLKAKSYIRYSPLGSLCSSLSPSFSLSLWEARRRSWKISK